jgi:hypothetical protein
MIGFKMLMNVKSYNLLINREIKRQKCFADWNKYIIFTKDY